MPEGVVVLVAGIHAANLGLFLVGGVVAGIGAGVLFKSAIASVAAMAAPAKRGEALAGLFLIAYLGLTVPVVAIGLATLSLAAVTVMTWFAVVLLILLAGVAVLGRRRAATGCRAGLPVHRIRRAVHAGAKEGNVLILPALEDR